jgi:hypothetical protein
VRSPKVLATFATFVISKFNMDRPLASGGPTCGRCPLLSSACVRFTRHPDSARTAVPGRAIPHWSNALKISGVWGHSPQVSH